VKSWLLAPAVLAAGGLLAGCGAKNKAWVDASAPTLTEAEATATVEKTFDYKHYYTNEFVAQVDSAPPPLVPARPLRLGLYWVANDQIAPWFVGIDLGYFKAVGIDLTIVEGGPSRDNLSKLAGGAIDIYAGFAESIYKQITSRTGTDLMMVSANLKGTGNAWIMLDHTIPPGQRSTVQPSLANLKGARIGISSGAEYWAAFVRDHYHLGPDDLKIVNVGATPDALIAGTVDWFQGWYDDQPRLLDREGYHNYVVLKFDAVGFASYSYISAVTRPYYLQNKDLLRAYVYALHRSVRFVLDHPDQAAALVAKDVTTYALTPDQVRWRIEQDRPLFVGHTGEPLLAFDDGHMLHTVAQLYRYHEIELPRAP